MHTPYPLPPIFLYMDQGRGRETSPTIRLGSEESIDGRAGRLSYGPLHMKPPPYPPTIVQLR